MVEETHDVQTIIIKKNYTDVTALIFWSLQVSFIHFGMLMGLIFVQFPDPAKAREFDQSYNAILRLLFLEPTDPTYCEDLANHILYTSRWILANRLFIAFVTLSRELLDGKVDGFTNLNNGFETLTALTIIA